MDFRLLGADEEIEGSRLRAFFPEGTEVEEIARELERALPGVRCRKPEPEPSGDWLSEWKKSFTGFSLGDGFFVLPTWNETPKIDRAILRLDPEQAFGTGTHDTTRLSAQLLERLVRPGDRIIDLGTGTGILAMVAAHRGASSVLALEPDEDAARSAAANVQRNQLSRLIRVETRGYEDLETLEAEVIVANINRTVLEEASKRMKARTVVLSGLLVDEVNEFLRELPQRYRVRERWSAGDWAALVLA
ncbi:MAG: 50S ribosomal protein L11 methyltransferase [Vicinamibacteria bacterium]